MSSYYTRRSRYPAAVGNVAGIVNLAINFGYKQIGGSCIQLGQGAPIQPGHAFNLGPANQLVGKSVLIKSVVADLAVETNVVNVAYNISVGGGVPIVINPPIITVDDDGDPAIFITLVDFH